MEKNITNYLAFRWMALYMLYCDDDMNRANLALSEKIAELEEKVCKTERFSDMSIEQRNALLNETLAKEVRSYYEIPWNTDPKEAGVNLELAVARRVEELSTRMENNPSLDDNYCLWARVGTSFTLTRDEVRLVLTSEDSSDVENILIGAMKDGRSKPDGESYIPQCVAERAAAWLGEEISGLDDIEF